MRILALDTSTEMLGIAVSNGEKTIELIKDVDLRHSETLIPTMEYLLSEVGFSPKTLELIVVSRGPGSFTGLRLGMAAAKGLAAGAACPLVSVPTLDAYSEPYAIFSDLVVLPVLDAKKKRFYASFYRGGERLTDYFDATPEAIFREASPFAQILLTGPHAELLYKLCDPSKFLLDPYGRSGRVFPLLKLGEKAFAGGVIDSLDSAPLYIRPCEAETSLFGGGNAE